jgi:hypothetical protein
MFIVLCPQCGKKNNSLLSKCPHCGASLAKVLPEQGESASAPEEMPFGMRPMGKLGNAVCIAGIAVIAASLLSACFYFFVWEKIAHNRAVAESKARNAEFSRTLQEGRDLLCGYDPELCVTFEPEDTVQLKVSANELFRRYQENPFKADQDFKGKWTGIGGYVSGFGYKGRGTPYVALETDSGFHTVDCLFPKAKADKLASLSKGDFVAVICTGRGTSAGNPVFGHCELI